MRLRKHRASNRWHRTLQALSRLTVTLEKDITHLPHGGEQIILTEWGRFNGQFKRCKVIYRLTRFDQPRFSGWLDAQDIKTLYARFNIRKHGGPAHLHWATGWEDERDAKERYSRCQSPRMGYRRKPKHGHAGLVDQERRQGLSLAYMLTRIAELG